MDIHQFKIFVSVFKYKSFSKASRELNLTQPTISNHIKLLEKEFDLKLFERLGRTITATKQAKVLYEHAVEIIESADILKEAIRATGKDTTGRIIIGASTIPGEYLLPEIIFNFWKIHPSVFFNVEISDSGEIIERVSKHDLLMGIVGTKLPYDQIKYTGFIEDELIAVSSPSSAVRHSIRLNELVKLPMIMREEGSGTRREFEKLLDKKSISTDDLNVAGVLGSADAVKQAVKAGLGVSIVSKLSVDDELRHKTLKEIKLTDIEIKRRFYLVTHKKRTLPALYVAFMEHVLSGPDNPGIA
jgi:DNA-binding transcriptional LysR family regulator